MRFNKRLFLLIATTVIAILLMCVIDPIKQDINYHSFADTREFASIPNFFNVTSNLPFIFIGVAGIRQFLKIKPDYASSIALKSTFLAFFIGITLTGIGSGYYHLNPNNDSLLWDRLPMTISFMAFFSMVVGECISEELADRIFPILIALGIASVFYWFATEVHGRGDLRPYLLVQFLPVALLPLILWLFAVNRKDCSYVWAVLGTYFLAKTAELFDRQLFSTLQVISGHSLKHLFAACGTYIVYRRFITLTENETL